MFTAGSYVTHCPVTRSTARSVCQRLPGVDCVLRNELYTVAPQARGVQSMAMVSPRIVGLIHGMPVLLPLRSYEIDFVMYTAAIDPPPQLDMSWGVSDGDGR